MSAINYLSGTTEDGRQHHTYQMISALPHVNSWPLTTIQAKMPALRVTLLAATCQAKQSGPHALLRVQRVGSVGSRPGHLGSAKVRPQLDRQLSVPLLATRFGQPPPCFGAQICCQDVPRPNATRRVPPVLLTYLTVILIWTTDFPLVFSISRSTGLNKQAIHLT